MVTVYWCPNCGNAFEIVAEEVNWQRVDTPEILALLDVHPCPVCIEDGIHELIPLDGEKGVRK
ncbi:MAG: hypothetical protein JRE40_10295 [Deltaproteobacteria bacterium]|nr:hypothetical protein [Deltaproteobacteria bacterium]MBW2673929.1 hypothetical protein [Deltaproteobacteria bacterium]